MKKAWTKKVLTTSASTNAISSSTGSSRSSEPFFASPAPAGNDGWIASPGAVPSRSGIVTGNDVGGPPGPITAHHEQRTARGARRGDDRSQPARQRVSARRSSRFSLILAALPRSSRR